MTGIMRTSDARSLRGEIERLFDEFAGLLPTRGREGRSGVWAPAVDIKENADSFIVTAELPGMSKDEINVEVENGTLTIKGERRFEKKEEGENYHFIERSYGSFYRSFGLPKNVSADSISAEYKDGVLHINLPKAEEVKAKKVSIEG